MSVLIPTIWEWGSGGSSSLSPSTTWPPCCHLSSGGTVVAPAPPLTHLLACCFKGEGSEELLLLPIKTTSLPARQGGFHFSFPPIGLQRRNTHGLSQGIKAPPPFFWSHEGVNTPSLILKTCPVVLTSRFVEKIHFTLRGLGSSILHIHQWGHVEDILTIHQK